MYYQALELYPLQLGLKLAVVGFMLKMINRALELYPLQLGLKQGRM